jgi:hypothetical protein
MKNTFTPSAYTPAPWLATKTSIGEWLIHLEDGSSIALVGDGPHEGDMRTAQANARLIAAAPDGLKLAKTFQESCEEHMSVLNDEMVAGKPDASEGDLDDLQDQIDHWQALKDTCDAFIAKAEGR